MSHLIYFYKCHEELTQPQIEMLNEIYNSNFPDRYYPSILKYIIIVICLFSTMRILHLAIKLKRRKSSSFIFTVVTSVIILNIIAYVSFIFWLPNNVFRTQSFPGSTKCHSKRQLQLERVRVALYHWSATSEMWLTIFISGLHLDCLRRKQLLLPLNARLPPPRLRLGVISMLLVSALSIIPDVLLTEIIPYNQRNETVQECYEWKTSLAHSVTTMLLEETGPTLMMLGLAVMIKVELVRNNHLVRDRLGTRAIRLMSNVADSAIGLKKSVLYLLLIMILTSLASYVRHFLIIIGIYDTKKYLLDEKCCDLIDCFLLLNTSFPVAFCFSLKRHTKRFEIALKSASPQNSTPVHQLSFTLIDLMSIEKHYNRKADELYETLHRRRHHPDATSTQRLRHQPDIPSTHRLRETSTSDRSMHEPELQDQG